MVQLESDRALLDAFRRGEREALDRVYRAYAEEIATILVHGFQFRSGESTFQFRGLDSRFDLEDVLQEVFVRAFTDAARLAYDGLRPYGPYLAAIARTTVIDRLRIETRWQRRFSDVAEALTPLPPDGGATDPVEGQVDPAGDPARNLENAELVTLMQQLMAELTAEEAEIFRLRFREGRSLVEVEKATGRTASKVKTLERRLRARVIERIWEAGYLKNRVSPDGWFARLLAQNERKGGA